MCHRKMSKTSFRLYLLYGLLCFQARGNLTPTPGPTTPFRMRVTIKSRVVISIRTRGGLGILFPTKEQAIFRKGLQISLPKFITSMDDVIVTNFQLTSPTSKPTPLPTPIPTKLPIPVPTSLPIPSPTAVPVPAPTELPVPAPTSLPIPSPTMLPVPAPTSLPIPAPTSPTAEPTPKPTEYCDPYCIGWSTGIYTLKNSDTTMESDYNQAASQCSPSVYFDMDAKTTTSGVAGTANGCHGVDNCGVMSSECSGATSNSQLPTSEDPTFMFAGSVAAAPGGCCTAKSCVAGRLTTEAFDFDTSIHNGIKWAFFAQAGGDWYEAIAALYPASDTAFSGSPVAAKCYRGNSFAGEVEDAISWSTGGSYVLAFYVASYDRSGGTALGSKVRVGSFGLSVTDRRLLLATSAGLSDLFEGSRAEKMDDDLLRGSHRDRKTERGVVSTADNYARTLSSAGVVNDLDVDFEFAMTSSETDAELLTASIHKALVRTFVENPNTSAILFNTHLLDAALLLGYKGTNSTAGTAEAGAINVLGALQEPQVVLDLQRFVTAAPTTAPILTIDKAVIEIVVAVIGAAVGISVGASVGASIGASSSGGGANSNPSGDPLSLIFLIQAVSVTEKLSCMHEAYSSMIGPFSVFNLQIAPPGPLREFWQLDKWAPWWFSDDTEASKIFSGHLFWSLLGWITTFLTHQIQLFVLRHILHFPVPGFLQFPQVEIVALLVMSMGILNTSAAVLFMKSSAWGWKILAIVEIGCVILFLKWFLRQQKKFLENVEWTPAMNVAQMKLFNVIDADGDGNLSLDEMLAVRQKLGLTEQQACDLFAELDFDGNGTVSAEEFREFYKDKKITFANTTCFEGFLTMVFTPRRGMGKWVPIDDAAPGSQRFAQFFAKFTPMQTSYYFMNMTRQVFEALLLNGAQSFPAVQVISLALVNLYFGYSVSANKAYILIAQSRADMWTAIGRAVTYLVALFAYYGYVPMQDAVWAMIVNQSLMILQAIFTQMYPVFVSLLGWLYSQLLWPIVFVAMKVAATRRKKEEEQHPEKYNQPKIISIVPIDTPARTPNRQMLAETKHIRRTSGKFDPQDMKVIGTSLDRPFTPKNTLKQLWDGKEPPARDVGRWEQSLEPNIKVLTTITTTTATNPTQTLTRQEMAERKHVRRTSHMFGIQSADL